MNVQRATRREARQPQGQGLQPMRLLTDNYTLGMWAVAALLLVAAGIGRGDSISEAAPHFLSL